MPAFNPDRTGKPQLDRMSHRHDALLRWIIANPDRTLGECAQELGYTQAWISFVIHSDIFQARYHEMRGEFDSVVMRGLQDKLTGLAHLALDKMSVSLEVTNDPAEIRKTSEMLLTRLGYGAPKGLHLTMNQYNQQGQIINGQVSRPVLERARALREAQIPAALPQASEPVATLQHSEACPEEDPFVSVLESLK